MIPKYDLLNTYPNEQNVIIVSADTLMTNEQIDVCMSLIESGYLYARIGEGLYKVVYLPGVCY